MKMSKPLSYFVGISLAAIFCVALARTASVYATPVGAAQQPTADQGKQVFEKRCTGCHTLDKAKEGPPLRGVIGRKAGTVPGFPYSAGVKALGITWDQTNIQQWLKGPDEMVPDTDMSFSLSNADERAAVALYLASLK